MLIFFNIFFSLTVLKIQAMANEYQPTLGWLQNGDKQPFVNPWSEYPRPLSETTEIIDTDYDSDSEGYMDVSPSQSVQSVSLSSRIVILP